MKYAVSTAAVCIIIPYTEYKTVQFREQITKYLKYLYISVARVLLL